MEISDVTVFPRDSLFSSGIIPPRVYAGTCSGFCIYFVQPFLTAIFTSMEPRIKETTIPIVEIVIPSPITVSAPTLSYAVDTLGTIACAPKNEATPSIPHP